MSMNLIHRSKEKEIMDEGIVGHEDWLLFLRDLTWVNRYLISMRSFTSIINKFQKPAKPLKIAEFACGGGYLLQRLAAWANKRSLELKFFGYDINSHFIDHANQCVSSATKQLPIQFSVQDIFSPDFVTQQFDIIICNLFCHHLTDEQLILFFKQMYRQASACVIINDLHRHRLAHLGFSIFSSIMRFSPMTKHDGLVSIRRAFVKKEMVALIERAGVKNYKVKWCFPFYFNIVFYPQK